MSSTITEIKIEDSWGKALSEEFEKEYFLKLTNKVKSAYRDKKIYPSASKIFACFDNCPFEKVKVVILGQDPYHGPGQAHGLSFSVPEGITKPPSLRNIFKEVSADIGIEPSFSGDLSKWAKQGVLLLNSVLTVEHKKPGSHSEFGWQQLTDSVIKNLSSKRSNVVYMLWGSYAQKKESLINTSSNLVLKAAHPSPLSAYRGFLGCSHFSKANEYLLENNISQIYW